MPRKDKWLEPKEFREFVRWSCMTKAEKEHVGEPTTQKALAKKLGVSPMTLTRWKSMPEFEEARQALTDQWLAESRPKRMRASILTAQQPGKEGYRDRKLLFEMDGTKTDHQTVNHEVSGNVEVKARTGSEEHIWEQMMQMLRQKPEHEGKSEEELAGIADAAMAMFPERGLEPEGGEREAAGGETEVL